MLHVFIGMCVHDVTGFTVNEQSEIGRTVFHCILPDQELANHSYSQCNIIYIFVSLCVVICCMYVESGLCSYCTLVTDTS